MLKTKSSTKLTCLPGVSGVGGVCASVMLCVFRGGHRAC